LRQLPFRKGRNFVSDRVVLEYVGFESKGAVREYAFTVRGTEGAFTRFSVTDAGLADYKEAHTPQSRPSTSAHREGQEF
jgi:hypothetical protein